PPPPSSTLLPYTTLFRSWTSGVGTLMEAPQFRSVEVLDLDGNMLSQSLFERDTPSTLFEGLKTLEVSRTMLSPRTLAAMLAPGVDRKSTRLNSSHVKISY